MLAAPSYFHPFPEYLVFRFSCVFNDQLCHNICNIACAVHHVCYSWEEQQRHQEWLGNVVLPTASKQNGDQIESA